MTEEKMLELWDKSGGDIYKYADLVAEHEREACIAAIESTDRHRSDYFIAKIREDRGQE